MVIILTGIIYHKHSQTRCAIALVLYTRKDNRVIQDYENNIECQREFII